MSVKIRLTRMGSTHRPFYRLVVVDSRTRRDGRAVETLGYYNPLPQPAEIKVKNDVALKWLQNGAKPSDTARSLLKQVGVWQRFQLLKQGKPADEVEGEVSKILQEKEAASQREAEKQTEARETKPEPEVDEPPKATSTVESVVTEETAGEEDKTTETPSPEEAEPAAVVENDEAKVPDSAEEKTTE